jgi:putative transposase
MVRTSRARQDYATEQHRRLSAARLFARGQSAAAAARALGVTRQAASLWQRAWRAGGAEALRGAGRTGRPARLTGDQRCRLAAVLLEGAKAHGYRNDLWTLQRIAQVVRRHFGVSYHLGHVWKLLGQLGWSCQRPVGRARERDEGAIRRWLRYRWPRIKKRRRGAGCG